MSNPLINIFKCYKTWNCLLYTCIVVYVVLFFIGIIVDFMLIVLLLFLVSGNKFNLMLKVLFVFLSIMFEDYVITHYVPTGSRYNY